MSFNHHIPINTFGRSLHRLFSGRKKGAKDAKRHYINKTYVGTEDHFFEGINEQFKKALHLEKEKPKTDRERFGTPQGVIDVADDRITKKRIEELPALKKPVPAKRFKQQYSEDVKRFGTVQGIIDVANDEKRKEHLPTFPDDFSKKIVKNLQERYNTHPVDKNSLNPFSERYRDFPKAQITVHNTSNEQREVVLWGVNQQIPVNVPSFVDVQHQVIVTEILVPEGVHPQGIVFNPANNCMYVANQQSGNVTVINSDNQVITIIALEPEFPGFCSPVALAVNTNSSSSKYGYVYVACSVSNTLAVINLALELSNIREVRVRPVAVVFNPVNNCIYVANLVGNSVSVIDAETLFDIETTPFFSTQDPIGVGIHPVSGEVYIANSMSNNIKVYDATHNFITSIAGVGDYPVGVTYNPSNGSMYAVATNSNTISEIDPISHTVTTTIPVGNKPTNSFFNAANNFIYVQNDQDNTLSIIKSDNSIVATISVGEQNFGGAYNVFNNLMYVTDTTRHIIRVIGYSTINSDIFIDGDYTEMINDFKYSPAVIEHVRFVVTGNERINSFRFSRFTSTGTVKSRPISFELYASPQSALNVAEVTALAGTVIDGKMNWRFKLPAMHTVSVLFWYRQFEIKDLLSK